MTSTPSVPAGHMRNAAGHLVPAELVSQVDKLRDELVQELVMQARDVNAVLSRFKMHAFTEIAAFVQLSAQEYEVQVGGDKGNVTLMSFDGRYKVVRQVSDTLRFDERIQAAKALIDECLTEWGDKAPAELKVIVMNVFSVDKAGALRTDLVLGLRRWDIKHEKWLRAMDAISDSLQVVGSRSYFRVYERVGQTDTWQAITLDIASA